jgi:hypothetical protein
MKLSEIKAILPNLNNVSFRLENGSQVPEHFHITEVGMIRKHFIDCGGVIRKEEKVGFQLWNADDYEHRLKPQKLLNIIALSERELGLVDADIEVEYQGQDTIGKFHLDFDGQDFILRSTTTACLAEDQCGIPAQKTKLKLSELPLAKSSTCKPNSGCC